VVLAIASGELGREAFVKWLQRKALGIPEKRQRIDDP
jgi:hypothetical protein